MDRYRERLVKDKNSKLKLFKGIAITTGISLVLGVLTMFFPPALAATAIAKVAVDLTAGVGGMGIVWSTVTGISAAKASKELKTYDKENAERMAESNYMSASYERESVKEDMEAVSIEPTKEEEAVIESVATKDVAEPVKPATPEVSKSVTHTQEDTGRIL